MNDKINETGYHATSVRNSQKILKNGFDKSVSNQNKKHWLGDGVYFFTDIAWAVQWNINALKKKVNKNKTKEDFTILKSNIEVEDSYFLDFSSIEGEEILEYLKDGIIKKLKEENRDDLIDEINNRSSKFLINLLDDYGLLDDYYVLKATYIDRRKLNNINYSDDFILNSQCQICVRNIGCIKSTKDYKDFDRLNDIYSLLKSKGDNDGKD